MSYHMIERSINQNKIKVDKEKRKLRV